MHQAKRRNKRNATEKESPLSTYDNIYIYTHKQKNTNEVLKSINYFSKVSGCKLNHKTQLQRKRNSKTMSFKIT